MVNTSPTRPEGTIIQVTPDMCVAAETAALDALSAQAPHLRLSPAALVQAIADTRWYYAAIAQHLPPAHN